MHLSSSSHSTNATHQEQRPTVFRSNYHTVFLRCLCQRTASETVLSALQAPLTFPSDLMEWQQRRCDLRPWKPLQQGRHNKSPLVAHEAWDDQEPHPGFLAKLGLPGIPFLLGVEAGMITEMEIVLGIIVLLALVFESQVQAVAVPIQLQAFKKGRATGWESCRMEDGLKHASDLRLCAPSAGSTLRAPCVTVHDAVGTGLPPVPFLAFPEELLMCILVRFG